jgi:23S rRNA (uridine2552-2'-O)-methyltransferase
VYRRKDAYYARAKQEGYRSRSAFKLLELARRHRLIRSGDVVVDLGAWPGGWLQVAATLTGPRGRVVGVDLRLIEPLRERHVVSIEGNVAEPEVRERILAACGRRADVLLSDLAPRLSGVRARDEAESAALAETVLTCAAKLLAPGGRSLVKLFMSADFQNYIARLRALFRHVSVVRPSATRKGSAEIYALGFGYCGPVLSEPPSVERKPAGAESPAASPGRSATHARGMTRVDSDQPRDRAPRFLPRKTS